MKLKLLIEKVDGGGYCVSSLDEVGIVDKIIGLNKESTIARVKKTTTDYFEEPNGSSPEIEWEIQDLTQAT